MLWRILYANVPTVVVYMVKWTTSDCVLADPSVLSILLLYNRLTWWSVNHRYAVRLKAFLQYTKLHSVPQRCTVFISPKAYNIVYVSLASKTFRIFEKPSLFVFMKLNISFVDRHQKSLCNKM